LRPRTEAAAVTEAATHGPLPFEAPHILRARMRELSTWLLKARGEYPDR
jgi:hypothetical protein